MSGNEEQEQEQEKALELERAPVVQLQCGVVEPAAPPSALHRVRERRDLTAVKSNHNLN